MIVLTLFHGGNLVYVNPDCICAIYVCNDRTLVQFGHPDSHLAVRETPEQINQILTQIC